MTRSLLSARVAPDAPGVELVHRARDPLNSAELEILAGLDPARLPSHLAVIMDGNGRWARKAGMLDRIRGHEAGTESVRQIVRACAELELQALTLYCFSSENWARPEAEVSALMQLLKRFLIQEEAELQGNGVRLVASGQHERVPQGVLRELHRVMKSTAHNQGLVLNLALSYGSRQEITAAFRQLATEVAQGTLCPDQIDESLIASRLDHPQLGDPDLLIRTSGEMRISNFMLWQLAYTEIHVTPVYWPEFRRLHLYEALADYQQRDRRFGRVAPIA
jgi:undecaprenyl diphosphate synthase